MIVITTPTGHIGSKVLEELLQTKEKLRLIARDPSKISTVVRERVEIVQGSLDDASVLEQAYEGAGDLFFVIPPSNQYKNADDYYLQFSRLTCEAIERKKVKRVIYVSGTGLGKDKNAGPVSSSYLVEEALMATSASVQILHCGTFMENLLHSVQSMKGRGEYGNAIPADVKYPWVATRDIAAVAVRLLMDKSWSGKNAVGILGPEDLDYNEVTRTISEVLGKDIRYQEIPDEAFKARMIQFGASEAAAQGLVDISRSVRKGTFNMVERTSESSSPTGFRQWCQEVLSVIYATTPA